MAPMAPAAAIVELTDLADEVVWPRSFARPTTFLVAGDGLRDYRLAIDYDTCGFFHRSNTYTTASHSIVRGRRSSGDVHEDRVEIAASRPSLMRTFRRTSVPLPASMR